MIRLLVSEVYLNYHGNLNLYLSKLFSDGSSNIYQKWKNIKFVDKNEILKQMYSSNIIKSWLKRTVLYLCPYKFNPNSALIM